MSCNLPYLDDDKHNYVSDILTRETGLLANHFFHNPSDAQAICDILCRAAKLEYEVLGNSPVLVEWKTKGAMLGSSVTSRGGKFIINLCSHSWATLVHQLAHVAVGTNSHTSQYDEASAYILSIAEYVYGEVEKSHVH
jgi:hypothetical protein